MSHSLPTYNVQSAWKQASLYFVACWLIAGLSGTLAAVGSRPLIPPDQSGDPFWWVWTAICTIVIGVGYGIIWPRGTLTHGRPLTPISIVFGFMWGVSEGLLFVSVWWLIGRLATAPWLVAVITFLILSSFKGVWHSQYWDIHVSPEHNIEEWNLRKVLFTHTPNLIVTLIHLAWFDNLWLFILWQTAALTLSAYFMHFPSPFEKKAR